jgi:hypothetical protein
VLCDYPIKSNIKPTKVLSLLFNKTIIKHQEWCSLISISLIQAIDHTCTLAEAIKINILNIAFLFTINKINAYKNKYNPSGLKLSLTVSMVQNKPRKPTNTSVAFIDLDLHNYD